MQSGKRLLPPGTIWHHPIDNPNVVQLLTRQEHADPLLQLMLHPDSEGGYVRYYGP
jgi:hypothetical protein